jgi:hypothetical protein
MQVILAYLMFNRSVENLAPTLLPVGRGPRAWIFGDGGWKSFQLDRLTSAPGTLLEGASRAIFVLEDSEPEPAPPSLREALNATPTQVELFLLLHGNTVSRTLDRVSNEFKHAPCRTIDTLQHEAGNPAYRTCCELLADQLPPEDFWQRWVSAQHVDILNQLAILCAIEKLRPDPESFPQKFNAIKRLLPQHVVLELNLESDHYWDDEGALVVSRLIQDLDRLALELASA